MVRTGQYRAAVQADKWVGQAVAQVLGLDLDDEVARRKIKALLKAWFASKALIKEERKDAARKVVEFVVPGPGPDDDDGVAPV